jgi:hypothetical protein
LGHKKKKIQQRCCRFGRRKAKNSYLEHEEEEGEVSGGAGKGEGGGEAGEGKGGMAASEVRGVSQARERNTGERGKSGMSQKWEKGCFASMT